MAAGLLAIPLATPGPGAAADLEAGGPVRFNRDIRPILSEHCWRCHGFDAANRAAGLRLDDREAATGPLESGSVAIVPRDPAASELLVRLTAHDESIRMPPEPVHKRPSPAEIELVRRWIAEGAAYEPHWAFIPPERPPVPQTGVPGHPVDAFVAARLAAVGRGLAAEADRDTLIRRVYFDLLGLPPTPLQLEVARRSSWDDIVDSLLASPHFGERLAVDWLDAARYADTDGYFGDKPRQMWLWRDWVIRAFNDDMPFDRFTIDQLAGDLLPDATVAQKVATGFNRNHMTNDETGLIDEEYRVEYVADRLDTTMSTWLGLTVGCAQCHDHKFDPVSHREYYRLFAFFNNVPETGLQTGTDPPPSIPVPSPEQERRIGDLARAAAVARAALEPHRHEAAAGLERGEAELLAGLGAPPAPGGTLHVPLDGAADGGTVAHGTSLVPAAGIRGRSLEFDGTRHLEHDLADLAVDGPWTLGVWFSCGQPRAALVSKVEPAGRRRGIEFVWERGRLGIDLTHVRGASGIELVTRDRLSAKEWHHAVVRHDGSGRAAGITLFVDGSAVPVEVHRDDLRGTIATAEPLRIGRRDEGLGFHGSLDEFRWLPGVLDDEAVDAWCRGERLRGILERPAAERTERDRERLLGAWIDRRGDPAGRAAWRADAAARAAEQAARAAIPTALVMEETSPPRATHVLDRGSYDKPLERVQPGVPAVLAIPGSDPPANRLGLARWLVDRRHPLTARVAVNRLWRQCFGEGLVRTGNDFGTQGEPPTHPELLDWLATEYRETWSTKALLKLLVTSRTYRQRSHWQGDGGERFDPENRLLARGPAFRLPWEMIRDQALVASGLFVPTIGGPSVKPYQPPGLWEEVSYNAEAVYEVDSGPGRHRRSLYTFHKRQAPPPSLLVFDGPTREKCTLKRARTNTPLQALVLLNDETWLESSRALAASLLAVEADDRARMTAACARVLSRAVSADELGRLTGLLATTRTRLAADPAAAALITGRDGLAGDASASDRAAWTIVVHTLFNLDEAITRR